MRLLPELYQPMTVGPMQVVGDAHDVASENAGTIFANISQTYDVARQV